MDENIPGGNFLGGIFLRGNLPGGSLIDGSFPGGSFLDTPAKIYLFKVNNRNTRKRCEICSKFKIKTPEPRLTCDVLAGKLVGCC